MAQNVVEIEGVSKDYSSGLLGLARQPAVADITFHLAPGEVFGLLGPNRAGKTTLVKLLLALCQPTRGRILRFGQPSSDRRSLRRVGYVPENQAFPRYLSANSLLHYYGALSLVPEPVLEQRVPLLLEKVGLADRAHEPIARFSKGMIQRVGIAQALVNDPELLVFDEPNEGLDLPGRQLIRDLVRAHKAQGRTTLFVSHVLPEVEQLCDRVAVLKAGRIVHMGPVAELLRDPATGTARSLETALTPHYS